MTKERSVTVTHEDGRTETSSVSFSPPPPPSRNPTPRDFRLVHNAAHSAYEQIEAAGDRWEEVARRFVTSRRAIGVEIRNWLLNELRFGDCTLDDLSGSTLKEVLPRLEPADIGWTTAVALVELQREGLVERIGAGPTFRLVTPSSASLTGAG